MNEDVMTGMVTSQWLIVVAPVVIVVVFIISLLGLYSKKRFPRAIAHSAPVTLTSLGVFFTFVGVWIALQQFDATDIKASTPALLSGLRLAFISSVYGLLAALIFRFVQAAMATESDIEDIAAKHLYLELCKLNEKTELVHQALAGPGDASLYAQLEKLRGELGGFAKTVALDGTEALIEALKAVILDFNEKINEQFGDNFKQLNIAVGRLLEWQKQNAKQIILLKRSFEENKKGIHHVRVSVEAIEKATGEIPKYISTLEAAFIKVHDRAEQLRHGFETLSDMGEAAKDAVPHIEERIQKLGSELSATVEAMAKAAGEIPKYASTLDAAFSKVHDRADQLGHGFETLSDMGEAAKDAVPHIDERIQKLGSDLSATVEAMAKAAGEVQKYASTLDATFSKVHDRAEQLEHGFETLSDMGEAAKDAVPHIEERVREMGNDLVGIAERLLEVYSKFEDAISEVYKRMTRLEERVKLDDERDT